MVKMNGTQYAHIEPAAGVIELSGCKVNVVGNITTEDEHGDVVSIPIIDTMTDFRWELLCFIDRLFHPDKYTANGEDVPAILDKIIEQLGNMSPEGKREAVKAELSEMRSIVSGLPESEKPAAEKYYIEITR